MPKYPQEFEKEMNDVVKERAGQTFNELENTQLFDFNGKEDKISTLQLTLTPEEQRQNNEVQALEKMRICMNIDEFFDVVF